MRGATSVTLQPHQILRRPHRMTRMLDRRHIWNVIYNARSNRCHPPTSPNIAPATQNDSHAWSSSHRKRHLQCAEQQVSPSNLSKYCACHTEWLACLIVVTYETSFTMRGATGVTIHPHQILRLPHRMTRMLDRRQMLVLEASSVNLGESLAQNARFWSVLHEIWRKSRTKCSGVLDLFIFWSDSIFCWSFFYFFWSQFYCFFDSILFFDPSASRWWGSNRNHRSRMWFRFLKQLFSIGETHWYIPSSFCFTWVEILAL